MSDSGFDQAVSEVFRGLKRLVEARPVVGADPGKAPSPEDMDRSVKEQVLADLDGLIRRRH